MSRLGGGRDGENEHRRTFGTFDAALAASGIHMDASQRAKVLEVIAEVSEIEGCPPDTDGFTVQTSRGEVRVVWDWLGKIVVHPGFIHCRHQLNGFGRPNADGWHELSFPNRGRGGGRSEQSARTWLCGCFVNQGPGVDVCDECGAKRPT